MDVPYRTKESIRGEIRKLVDPGVYARGFNYYRDGLVGEIELYTVGKPDSVGVRAKVFGTKAYSTSFTFSEQDGILNVRCSCPYEWGYCKHAVALGLKYSSELYGRQGGLASDHSEPAEGVLMRKSGLLDSTDLDMDMFFVDALKSIKTKREEDPKKEYETAPVGNFFTGTYGSSRFEEKYSLVLSRGYHTGDLRFEITDGKANAYHYGIPYSEILRKEEGNLNEDQKELLEYLDGGRRKGAIDAGTVLELTKKASIGMYWGRKAKSNALRFSEMRPEIKAKIFFKQSMSGAQQGGDLFADNVTLALEGNLGDERSVKMFSSDNWLITIEDNQINMYPSTPLLSGILARMFMGMYEDRMQKGVRRSRWSTRLGEEEIINCKELIRDAGAIFALEHEFSKDLTMHKWENVKPVIVVDFDAQEAKLKVVAMMDYGFEKVDIGTACFRSVKNERTSFQRRFNPSGEKYLIRISKEVIDYALIDAKTELEMFGKLCSDNRFGFSKTLTCKKQGSRQVTSYLENNWPFLKKAGYPIEFVRDEIECATENFKADINVDFNTENDLLAFDFECYCGEDKIGLEDLRKYVEGEGAFLKTGDGRLLKVANREELEKFIHMLESFHKKEGQRFEGKAYHAPELGNVIAESNYYNTRVSEGFRSFMHEAQEGKPVENVKIPEKMGAVLRQYQKEGINWFYFLRKYRFGGILADDMGLGKTLQALLLIDMNREAGKPTIVVCPKTLLFNWQDEATKFFPKLKTLVVDGAPREREGKIKHAAEYDLVVTSFSALKKDADIYAAVALKFNYCIVDEAQYIKNQGTLSAKAVKKIDADYRIAMTGTPLENSISEIWSIFDFVMPGFLGNYSSFKARFENPIMKQSDAEALADLRGKISCFMLRRSKSAVLKELPPKVEQIAHCQLGDHQNILYQEILANTKKEIFDTVKEKGFAKSQIHILAALMKLRQVCNHPALLLKDVNYRKYESAKLDLFMELVDEVMASNRKVLVFSQFTSMLDILAKEMKAKKIEFNYLSGKTHNRKELVDDFNINPDKKVFLISLKAGGTGLNLVSADNVIIFDPWWNPSVENQAIDRAHRIGQKNSVNVYKLVTKGTIEEKILKLQEKKKFLFDNLVDESNDLFKKLTWDEVRELFD